MPIRKGRILGFNASGCDDGAKILIDDYDRGTVAIPCDFAQTLRSFEEQFGGVVDVQGRTADLSRVAGEEVLFALDSFGCLAAISRADTASPEVVALYEKRKPRATSRKQTLS